MASGVWGSAPWWGPPPPAPARPLTDIDFCSGAQLQELTQLIQELGVQESWSDAPKPGPDLLRAKDFVFSLLGLIHRRDPRFPPQAELLLLRGGVREGSLDLGPAPLGPYVRGPHYDAGFTLLVPVFSLDGTGQELRLDVDSSYAWLCLPERIRGTSVREAWQDCLGPPAPGGRDSTHRTESEGSPKSRQSSVDRPHGSVTEADPNVALEKAPPNVSGQEPPGQGIMDLGFPTPLENLNGDVTKAAVVSPGLQQTEGWEAWPTLCPAQVAAWFFASLAAVAESLFPVPGAPRLVHAARHAGFTTCRNVSGNRDVIFKDECLSLQSLSSKASSPNCSAARVSTSRRILTGPSRAPHRTPALSVREEASCWAGGEGRAGLGGGHPAPASSAVILRLALFHPPPPPREAGEPGWGSEARDTDAPSLHPQPTST
uniref:Transmembrane protein 102 n=1 Tax=Panthera tigris altaica TaxID=74533 RepID=A0A8C9JV06_PANTA